MKKVLILALATILALSLVSCGAPASSTPAASSTAASVAAESAAPEAEAETSSAADTTAVAATQDNIDPHSLSVEEFTKALPNVSTEKLTTMLAELEELRLVLREKAGKDQSDENVAEYYAVRDKKNAVDDELTKRNKK